MTSLHAPLPLDYDACLNLAGWEADFHWPVDFADVSKRLDCQSEAFLTFVGQSSIEDRDVLLLCGHAFMAVFRGLCDLSLTIQEADRLNRPVIGCEPESAWLRGKADALPLVGESRDLGGLNSAPSSVWLRRLVRTLSWTSAGRIPRALTQPDTTAVSHNPLMVRSARARTASTVGFQHSEEIVRQARASSPASCSPTEETEIVRALLDRLIDPMGLDDPYRQRLQMLAEPIATAQMARARSDLRALGNAPRLPRNIWSATGGKYFARAVGLEVLRRGGTAERFDHSGTSGMLNTFTPYSMIEFSVSSRFWVATKGVATRLSPGTRQVAAFRECDVAAGPGFEEFRAMSDIKWRKDVDKGPRLKVMYVSSGLTGAARILPSGPADPIRVDWQRRLIRCLQRLPIDLTVKPYPEGALKGRPQPLKGMVSFREGLFEDVMHEADVYIFDSPLTTALWKGLCSERQCVVIHFPFCEYWPEVERELRQRARVINVELDDRGRPTIDEEALSAAVLDNDEPSDPTWFRACYMDA